MKIVEEKGIIKKYGFSLIELLIAFVILTLSAFFLPPITTTFNHPISPQRENILQIKKSIDRYYADNGRYPKNLIDLTGSPNSYLAEVPVDPLTGCANWEVREKNAGIWYRTSDEGYPNAPAKWNPGPESSIYDVRPINIQGK